MQKDTLRMEPYGCVGSGIINFWWEKSYCRAPSEIEFCKHN